MGILLFSYVRLMRHKNRELELALAKAEAASTAKSYFTSRMSHGGSEAGGFYPG